MKNEKTELEYRRKMPVREYYDYPERSGYRTYIARYYVCPRCKRTIEIEYSKYCISCGQAFSWYGYRKYKQKLERI